MRADSPRASLLAGERESSARRPAAKCGSSTSRPPLAALVLGLLCAKFFRFRCGQADFRARAVPDTLRSRRVSPVRDRRNDRESRLAGIPRNFARSLPRKRPRSFPGNGLAARNGDPGRSDGTPTQSATLRDQSGPSARGRGGVSGVPHFPAFAVPKPRHSATALPCAEALVLNLHFPHRKGLGWGLPLGFLRSCGVTAKRRAVLARDGSALFLEL